MRLHVRELAPCLTAVAAANERHLTPMETARFCSMIDQDIRLFAARYSISEAAAKTHTRGVLTKFDVPNGDSLWRRLLVRALTQR